MKKLIIASVFAVAGLSLLGSNMTPAMAQDNISIKDQAEYNAFTNATTQTDPNVKASALESFVATYPQSVVKKIVLNDLIDTYQAIGNGDKTLDAATRLLQVDPNNLKAYYISVFVLKSQKKWDDAAAAAQRGLNAKKPVDVKDPDWKDQTGAVYPLFHSALASQALNAKGDYKTAIAEFNTELQLTPADQTNNVLMDMLTLAQTYADMKAKDQRDLVKACWFYARVWNYAPANYKPKIEQPLEYWYKKFHGSLDGLNDLKLQAAKTMFPPGTLQIKAAATPAEIVHGIIISTPDLKTIALADKETILTVGGDEDRAKIWAVMKDQVTPVPGIVIEASTTVIKVAVTDDAKQSKTADFIVNLKTPLAEKDVPAVGFVFGIPTAKDPIAELAGTYDSYSQVAATDTTPPAVLIVLKDGSIIPAAKKAPVHPTPAAGHKPGAAHHQ
jgi:tetratricopeptide (TPR) repeat protein